MLELVRIKKTVVTNVNGEEVKKHFTNFYLEIEINGQVTSVPIQPVQFGKEEKHRAQTRKNYQIMELASKLKEEKPF
jgi:hypothetical protein